jgi:hypothetical protein
LCNEKIKDIFSLSALDSRLQELVRSPPSKHLEIYIRQTNPTNYRTVLRYSRTTTYRAVFRQNPNYRTVLRYVEPIAGQPSGKTNYRLVLRRSQLQISPQAEPTTRQFSRKLTTGQSSGRTSYRTLLRRTDYRIVLR